MIQDVRREPGFCDTNDVIGMVGAHRSKLIKFWEQASCVEGENCEEGNTRGD